MDETMSSLNRWCGLADFNTVSMMKSRCQRDVAEFRMASRAELRQSTVTGVSKFDAPKYLEIMG